MDTLEEDDYENLKKYMCEELSYVSDESVQEYLQKIEPPMISIQIGHKPRGGIYSLICINKGVIHRQTKYVWNKESKDYSTKIYDTPILDVPFELNNLYLSQNDVRFYDVKIGNEDVCLNKEDLLNFIQKERNYAFISGRQLFDTVSIILRGYEKKKDLKEKRMYPAVGVFLDNKDNLKLIYPDPDEKIFELYGMNAYQQKMINRCEKKKLDKDGELLIDFYEFVHLKTYPKTTMIMTLGHSLISCFFNALRDDLDIFPDHYGIDPRKSVGKSTLFEHLYCICYGDELKNNDDINSIARFTEMCTANTFCLCTDDVDYVKEEIMSYQKSAGTNLKAKERMTKDQKLRIQDTYRTFSGTANSDNFLAGDKNDAYRGRCIISKDWKQLDRKFDKDHLDLLKEKIKFDKIFGYYLLLKSIEFIDSKIKDNILSTREKLKYLLRNNKKNLRKYLDKKGVFLDDTRRLTIYALIYTGCQMWDYAFKTKDFESPLLKEFLDYENNNLLKDIIETYEGTNLQISIDDLFNFIEFYESNKETLIIWRFEIKDKETSIPVITTKFINEYDKWAKGRNYQSLNKLPSLADMLSKILGEKVLVETIYVRNVDTEEKARKRGIKFEYELVKKRLGLKSPEEKASPNILKILSKEKYKKLKSRMIELFELNEYQPLEESIIIQILSIEGYEDLFLTEAFSSFIEAKILKLNKDGYLILVRE